MSGGGRREGEVVMRCDAQPEADVANLVMTGLQGDGSLRLVGISPFFRGHQTALLSLTPNPSSAAPSRFTGSACRTQAQCPGGKGRRLVRFTGRGAMGLCRRSSDGLDAGADKQEERGDEDAPPLCKLTDGRD